VHIDSISVCFIPLSDDLYRSHRDWRIDFGGRGSSVTPQLASCTMTIIL
jgi:hypothetical protein